MITQQALEIPTRGRGFTEITGQIQEIVARSGVRTGRRRLSVTVDGE